jgi:ABC-type antimicrobial peptide transport system permease subunit
VVLSEVSEATVRLTLVGTSSASRDILSYILKKYKFSAYYFLLLTIFTIICGGTSELIRTWVQEKEYQLETISLGVCRQMG